jgi:hypothetical protein
MALRILVIAVVALLIGAGVYLFLLRSPVEAPSITLSGVTIECDPWTGVSPDGCGSWGDAILAGGPPSRTFNIEDLERLRLSGAPLSLGGCRAEWFLGRDPVQPVWSDDLECVAD